MSVSLSTSTPKFPSEMEGKLRSVRWRHATLTIVRAMAAAWFVLTMLMFCSVVLDWLFPFMNNSVRVLMTSSTLLVSAVTLFVLAWKQVRNALGWDRAASSVDDEIPQLEQRWRTVASVLKRDPATLTAVEKAMADQVTSEAVAMGRVVEPRRITPPASPRKALIAAMLSTIIWIGLYAVFPVYVSVLLKRFWSPTNNLTATQLASLTGDQFVPRGQKIEVLTQLTGVRRSGAVLLVRDQDGEEQQYRMHANDGSPGQFAHTLRVDDTLTYRVRSGDGQTDWHQLSAIDYPEIDEIQFAIEFPDYTEREPIHRDRMPRRLKVVQGSTVDLAIKSSEPIEQLLVALESKPTRTAGTSAGDSDGSQTIYELSKDDKGWYRFRIQLLNDVILRPQLFSPHGLENRQRLFSRIEVIADKPPVARVVSPTDEMAVAFDEMLEIQFEAHDDHGIASAELVIYDESRKDAKGNPVILEVKDIPLGDQQMARHLMGKTELDLAALNLTEKSEISYSIRVTDNRDVRSTNQGSEDPRMQVANQERPSESTSDIESKDEAKLASKESSANAPSDGPTEAKDDLATMLEYPKTDGEALRTEERHASQHPLENLPTDPSAGDNRSTDPSTETSIAQAQRKDETTGPSVEDVAEDGATSPETNAAKDLNEGMVESNVAIDPESETKSTDHAAPAIAVSQEQKTESSSAARTTDLNEPTEESAGAVEPTDIASNSRRDGERSNNDENKRGRIQSERDRTAMDSDPKTERTSNQTGQPPRQDQQTDRIAQTQGSNRQPPPAFALDRQSNRSGQNTLTGRRRLKITERLAALASASDGPNEKLEVRENVVAIDGMLADIETALQQLADRSIADSDRGEQFRRVDAALGNVETYVADLREQTRENQYAFVGLQMVDITRTHVTPARDRVFAAIQRPNASDADAAVSLQHVVRSRELLAALLKRYDRVQQERKLKKALDESVTMYEVYLEKRRMLLREARQNLNPLQRKMAIIEVDQEYLDRLAEVLQLRRQMMDEFAAMLGDDPRLLSRYMELVKRRGKSLRDRLTEISQRQYEATEEALGWLQIDPTQKQDLWMIYIELRLAQATDLAKDSAELAERTEKQLPLEMHKDAGTAAELIRQAKKVAAIARQVSFDAEQWLQPKGDPAELRAMLLRANSLVGEVEKLSATLDQLLFENDGNELVTDYAEPRILETRAVANQADAWAVLCTDLATQDFSGIVATEQHRLAFETQVLRVEMLEIRSELDLQFQQVSESGVPSEITDMINELHPLMEMITFNQVASTYRARKGKLEAATVQQQLATDRLEQAEKLFDRIRRAVVAELDQYDVDDPNIADLRDPTLDEFLARLEREPSITAQLGIPNRRQNLRVLSDSVFWQQGGGNLGESGEAASQRAEQAMKMSRERPPKKKKVRREQTKEEREQEEAFKQAQKSLEKSLMQIQKQMEDPATRKDQKEQLQKMAEKMQKLMDQSNNGDVDRMAWQQLVQSDAAKRLLAAVARGEVIPDQQWNTLLSTLEDGLWQVRGKQPPEAYRKAIEQYEDQIRELMQTIDEG